MNKKLKIPTTICKTEPDKIYNIKSQELLNKSDEVSAICAIGQPSQFYDFLKDYNVSKTISYDDHHSYKEEEIPTGKIVTTEKDAVKMLDFKRDDIYALKLKTVLNLEELLNDPKN